MNEFFGSVWWLIVTLGLLITFHEYGHFVIARRCGVKVLKFSVGFGPALWSRHDRHGTEFVIAAIPLGGFVKMLDERESDEAIEPEALKHAFNRKTVGQRMAITAAGPVFNLIFTLAAFWLMFVIGKPDYVPLVGHVDHAAETAGFRDGDRIVSIDGRNVATWTDASTALLQDGMDRRNAKVTVLDADGVERQRTLQLSTLPADLGQKDIFREIGLTPKQWAIAPVVGAVTADSAAERAGLRPGDRFVSIDGDAIGDWTEVSTAIQQHAQDGKPLSIEIRRGADTLTLSAQPTAQEQNGQTRWLLGVGPQATQPAYDATLRYGPLAAVPQALEETWERSRQTLGMLGSMLTGQASLQNLSGVITIARVANESAQLGPAWFLNFLAIISLSLAILNLLPIPILDGGHLLYYLIELIKGSPVSDRFQIAGQYVGLTLLVALMGIAFYNDIFRNAF